MPPKRLQFLLKRKEASKADLGLILRLYLMPLKTWSNTLDPPYPRPFRPSRPKPTDYSNCTAQELQECINWAGNKCPPYRQCVQASKNLADSVGMLR